MAALEAEHYLQEIGSQEGKIDEQYLIKKDKELSPKQWHFTMLPLDALIDFHIMLHLFSVVTFLDCLALIICKS